jgi:hypothetical protein
MIMIYNDIGLLIVSMVSLILIALPGGSLPMTCVAHPHTPGFEKAPSLDPSGWRTNFSAPVVSDPFQLGFSW